MSSMWMARVWLDMRAAGIAGFSFSVVSVSSAGFRVRTRALTAMMAGVDMPPTISRGAAPRTAIGWLAPGCSGPSDATVPGTASPPPERRDGDRNQTRLLPSLSPGPRLPCPPPGDAGADWFHGGCGGHRDPRRLRAAGTRVLRARATGSDHRVHLHGRGEARPRGARAADRVVLGDDPARRPFLRRRGVRAARPAARQGAAARGALRALAGAVERDRGRAVRRRAGRA